MVLVEREGGGAGRGSDRGSPIASGDAAWYILLENLPIPPAGYRCRACFVYVESVCNDKLIKLCQ